MKKTFLSAMVLSVVITSTFGAMKTFRNQSNVTELLLEDIEAQAASLPPQFYVWIAEGKMTLAAAIQIYQAMCGDSDNSGDNESIFMKAVETHRARNSVWDDQTQTYTYVMYHEIECQMGGDLIECTSQAMHQQKYGICKHSS